jgi:hypothetical protein
VDIDVVLPAIRDAIACTPELQIRLKEGEYEIVIAQLGKSACFSV